MVDERTRTSCQDDVSSGDGSVRKEEPGYGDSVKDDDDPARESNSVAVARLVTADSAGGAVAEDVVDGADGAVAEDVADGADRAVAEDVADGADRAVAEDVADGADGVVPEDVADGAVAEDVVGGAVAEDVADGVVPEDVPDGADGAVPEDVADGADGAVAEDVVDGAGGVVPEDVVDGAGGAVRAGGVVPEGGAGGAVPGAGAGGALPEDRAVVGVTAFTKDDAQVTEDDYLSFLVPPTRQSRWRWITNSKTLGARMARSSFVLILGALAGGTVTLLLQFRIFEPRAEASDNVTVTTLIEEIAGAEDLVRVRQQIDSREDSIKALLEACSSRILGRHIDVAVADLNEAMIDSRTPGNDGVVAERLLAIRDRLLVECNEKPLSERLGDCQNDQPPIDCPEESTLVARADQEITDPAGGTPPSRECADGGDGELASLTSLEGGAAEQDDHLSPELATEPAGECPSPSSTGSPSQQVGKPTLNTTSGNTAAKPDCDEEVPARLATETKIEAPDSPDDSLSGGLATSPAAPVTGC